MPFLAAIARQLGLAGCVLLATLAIYEGIPLLREVPGIGPVFAGRVANAAAAARQGYVLEAERDAIAAELRERERQASAASMALEEHRRRLAASQEAQRALADKLELEIAQHEKELDAAGRACRLDDADLDWLLKP